MTKLLRIVCVHFSDTLLASIVHAHCWLFLKSGCFHHIMASNDNLIFHDSVTWQLLLQPEITIYC